MTSKSLPSDPTETMLHAGVQALRVDDLDPAHGEVAACYRAMYDAAPPVRLTRTDPPTEPGWYWGVKPTGDKRYDAVQPVLVRHCHEHPDKILAAYIGWFPDAYQIGGIEWFGPLVALEIAP